MDQRTFRAIRILALQSVEAPDWHSFYRRCCRWYSREFSTPLSEVEKMPETVVLQAFYEEEYARKAYSQSSEEREEYANIKAELIHGEQKIEQMAQDAAEADDQWAQELNEQVRRDWEKAQPKAETAQPPADPNLLALEESVNMAGEGSGDPTQE